MRMTARTELNCDGSYQSYLNDDYDSVIVEVFDGQGIELSWFRMFDFWYSGTKMEYLTDLCDKAGLIDVVIDEANSNVIKDYGALNG